MHCFACQSTMDAGDRWCAKCGAAAQQSIDPDSERKFVTILRADLVQSTDLIAELEPEQAVSRLEPALTAMRAAVRQFGGIVSKELGDGLTAVFGAPMANDNHAPMACHAALELVRRVTSLGDPGLQVRVGLHSGFVVAYVVASEFSRVYEIGGAAQHLAARLEAAAESGQIFASEACQKLAEGHVQFEFLGRKPLRGFAEPVPVYSVTGAGELSNWQVRKTRSVSRFVNRTEETALLRQLVEETRAGGRTVCLTGEPGIGKSRLVHEFVQELETRRLAVDRRRVQRKFTGLAVRRTQGIAALNRSTRRRRRIGRTRGWACRRSCGRPSTRCWTCLYRMTGYGIVWSLRLRGRAISDACCAIVEKLARPATHGASD